MDETGRTEHVPYTRVTVAEAAAALGVNVVTIRRMIKRGQLEAERVHRPQGSAYLVTLPGHGTAEGTPTEQPAQDMFRTQGTPAAPAEAMVSLIQTTIATVLGPLVAEQTALRQTVERQADELKELARENGRFAAEKAAAEQRYAEQEARTAAQAANSSQSAPLALLRRYWPLIVAVVVLVAAGVVVWGR